MVEIEFVLAVIDLDSRLNDEWVLVAACTSHMFPKKDWFINYESVNGGSILMGNGVACKIVGVVRIRMHHGIVRTLKNV